MAQQRFTDDFRRFFLRGLAALVPTLLTFAIIVWAFRLINDNVGYYIAEGLLQLCSLVRDEPAPGFVDAEKDALRYGTPINEWDAQGRLLTIEYQSIKNYKLLHQKSLNDPSQTVLAEVEKAKNKAMWRIAYKKYRFELLGFLVGIILVYFLGFFLASFIGRTSWRAGESLVRRIPLIRAVYSSVKQVTDFILKERSVEFSGVVAVQYPRKGIWSLGLTTGGPMKHIQERVDGELITVFIPSSPTPITGYVIQVPREDVVQLNMTIDEGLKFTVSGGVIKPKAELMDSSPQSEGV